MTPALRGAALACLLLAAALPDAAAAGFHDTLDELRAGRLGCPAAGGAPAFVPRPELERVARNLAYGGDLKASMAQSGYRAFRSYAIHLEGSRLEAQAAAPAVRWNDTLAEASRRHAEDMAQHDYFSHTGRDRSNPAQRVERAGYRYRATGENIAGGAQMTPEDVVAGWIRSPGHCANLMNPAFTEMGVAYAINAKSEMGMYWAQEFGTPR